MAILLDTLFDYTDSIKASVKQALNVNLIYIDGYVWIVTLSDYWQMGKVTLAVNGSRTPYPDNQTDTQRAAILIDECDGLGYVDTSHIEDRVLPALQGINLIVDEYETITTTVNPRINLWIDAKHGTREVAFELGGVSDASLIRLRDAVLAMIRDVYPLYHNPVLDAFFAQGIIAG